MSSDAPSTIICPTCGSKVAADLQRCVVCGADLVAQRAGLTQRGAATAPSSSKPRPVVRGPRIPEVTLSLPLAILLFAIFLAIGAILVYVALRQQPEIVVPPTATTTPTLTVTPSLTPTPVTPTVTNTPLPSPTPVTHLVKANETCIEIAFFYGVSVQSIVQLNNLSTDCALRENQPLLIPQPTATPTALPTATLNAAEQTEAACEKIYYTVTANDTLGGIAANYNVPMDAIREYNGLTGSTVFEGQPLVIPLCRRNATPGPTATATPPPPYAAPALLLPVDGAPFGAGGSVTLQWASVGALRENEYYVVTVEDVTTGEGQRVVDYVTDTKFIVPESLRPKDNVPHIFRWRVGVVRLTSTDAATGNPIYESAGATSGERVFSWMSSGGVQPTAAP